METEVVKGLYALADKALPAITALLGVWGGYLVNTKLEGRRQRDKYREMIYERQLHAVEEVYSSFSRLRKMSNELKLKGKEKATLHDPLNELLEITDTMEKNLMFLPKPLVRETIKSYFKMFESLYDEGVHIPMTAWPKLSTFAGCQADLSGPHWDFVNSARELFHIEKLGDDFSDIVPKDWPNKTK